MMMMHPPPRQQQHEGEPYNPSMSPAMAQYPPSGRYMPAHDGNTSSPELSSPDMHANMMPRNPSTDMDKSTSAYSSGPRPPPLGLNIQINNNDGWDRHRTNSTNSLSSSYVSSISSPPLSDDRMYQYGMVPTMNGSYPPPPHQQQQQQQPSSQKPSAIPYTPVEEDVPSMNRWQYRPEPTWSEHHPHSSEHRDGLVHPLQ
jgi:hypothetical protein